MIELLETVRLENGTIHNWRYHLWRIEYSRRKLGYHSLFKIDFPDLPKFGLFRIRILYADEVHKIEWFPYSIRKFRSIGFVAAEPKYHLKFSDRTEIDIHKPSHLDEVIFVNRQGFITDTSIANIAVEVSPHRWCTPATPILRGTYREMLIRNALLDICNLRPKDIENRRIAFINAMMRFHIPKIEEILK